MTTLILTCEDEGRGRYRMEPLFLHVLGLIALASSGLSQPGSPNASGLGPVNCMPPKADTTMSVNISPAECFWLKFHTHSKVVPKTQYLFFLMIPYFDQ